MQAKTFSFKPVPPYDLNLSLQRLKRDPTYTFGENAVCRTLTINQHLYLIKIYYQLENQTDVRIETVCLEGNIEAKNVQNTLERMLSIRCELHDIYDDMNRLPELKNLTKKFEGLHLFLDPDLFECMVKLIVAQQINTAFATALTRNLIEAISENVFYKDKHYFVFPTPSQLASLRARDLVKRKFNQRKAEYIIDFANRVHEGNIDLSKLDNMSDSDVMAELLKIRGIGPWTASCFMIFGLRRKNLVPASDIGIQKAVQNVYGLSHRPTKNEVLQLSEKWEPVASYVVRYLWESLCHSD